MWPTEKCEPVSQARLDELTALWIDENRSTAPSVRATAETAVRTIYRDAGLRTPRICWTPDPLAAVTAALGHSPSSGSIKDLLVGRLQGRVEAAIDSLYVTDIRHRLLPRLGTPGLHLGRDFVVAWSFTTDGDQLLPAGLTVAVIDVLAQQPKSPLQQQRRLVAYHLQNVLPGAANPLELAVMQASHEIGSSKASPSPVQPFIDLACSAGWVIPFPTVCWISERPSRLCVDDFRSLHAEDGPALAYPGGLEIFAWHGAIVPAHVVLSPETITPRAIRRQSSRVVQQIMIERFGLERFLTASGAKVVQQDETGRLWSRRLGLSARSRIVVVEVENGTPEHDGSRQHYFLQVPPGTRTARQGVAWSYGLVEHDYSLLVRT